jgi:hypothetical protein
MICTSLRVPFNPLRLASNYRDFFGDPHAKLSVETDPLLRMACFVSRIYHAPDEETETAGVEGNGYLEYSLDLPPGSLILGFLHSYTSQLGSDTANAPVGSSFRLQITDVARRYSFFEKPVPEAWLLQDQPAANPQSALLDPSGAVSALYVLNASPRLLASPYPVAPPGVFRIEFWNSLPVTNMGCRLSLLLAVPADFGDGGKQ